ncbi:MULTISPECIES: murein biosynthesis integral membrane protein MurJ [Agarivorans]|uniref:Probable lipid II flippase MurJ n=1 Tax=Agarivorans albus MKT 106 TaxID=1331007 RepID=R9PJI3_AGAAL|nr:MULTISPECIES: murein biosynthesis integral membrane protein MurJ [Agarivorans]GAD01544.1 proposed peptidoglycan lipid II flippase MurJ [Agarivorans albus MKT 106]
MSKTLLKSGAIVSAMTLISRILGLARDVVIANLMGAGVAADVFFFANKIPNFLRRLFAEGAFAQAFVPVLTEYKQKSSEDEVRELIAKVSGTLGLAVTIVTLFGIIGSPLIAALFGTGWFISWLNDGPDAAKFELSAFLLKITFPYLWFVTFTGLSGAILNAFGRFAVAAFTPVLLNVAVISFAIFVSPNLEQPEVGLAMGVFFGGLIQFLFQLPFLFRLKLLQKPSWGWKHPGVVKIRTLMIPALFGVSVSQINLLLDTLIASFLITGSISWLYYSDRLLEFPLGLFGIAIATVILPSLSQRHVDKSPQQFQQTMDWAVRMVCFLGIPATVGLALLGQPILQVLFMRGAFDQQDVLNASYSLMAYSGGLLFFMLVKVLAPGYYSRQDTKTPVKIGIIAMASNMGFNLIFAIPYGYIGLAIATALSALLNASLLYRGLHKQGVYKLGSPTLVCIVKILVASTLMGGLIVWLSPLAEQWFALSWIDSVWQLLICVAAAVISYLVLLFCLGIRLAHLKSSFGAVTAD